LAVVPAILGTIVLAARAEESGKIVLRTASAPSSVALAAQQDSALRLAEPADRLIPIDPARLKDLRPQGGTAGTIPGTTVYDNFFVPAPGQTLLVWTPGVNPVGATTELMADDIQIAAAGPLTGYSLAVAGFGSPGAPTTYTVRTALWTGPPCETGSTMIAGTSATSPPISNNGSAQLIEITFTEPITTPPIVWLSAGFDTDDAGWIIAHEAEIGYTRDLWSENDVDGGNGCARLFLNGNPFVGFWATVYANLTTPPLGACCNGQTCSQQTQIACATGGGTWSGPFSGCDPSPCVNGACCGGLNFDACLDTFNDPVSGDVPVSEAFCKLNGGLFYPGTTCTLTPCDSRFATYVNVNGDGRFFVQQDDPVTGITLVGDDHTAGPGAPCELDHFDIGVSSISFSGAYDVIVELRALDTNTMDRPGEVIPGTQTVFPAVGDGADRVLRAGPFTGITLPEVVFMVMRTSTDDSGWLLADRAEVGVTGDFFFLFNLEAMPGAWLPFMFTGTPAPYAGLHSEIWCRGETPVGACCNDLAGTCNDEVTQQQCEGRWAEGELCAFQPFTPPCGAAACCTGSACQNIDPIACEGLGGVPARGRFCVDIEANGCPRPECLNRTGDCFTAHQPAIGCEDPYCCEAVCDADSFCCNPINGWDLECANTAADVCQLPLPDDHCVGAIALTTEGVFPFDNTLATTDGVGHTACATGLTNPTDAQIAHDVWRCFTAPCSGPVYVQSCNLTSVDTKLAVYQGCNACPPDDAALRDCNDDFCGYDTTAGFPFQSSVSFNATLGQSYLIRIGTFPGGGAFPGADGGPGSISISCGVPDHHNCPNPAGECCDANVEIPACEDDTCCDVVCACDPFCCEVEWDAACSSDGFESNGCGAELLCDATCNPVTCPVGQVTFMNPASGIIDARQPFAPNTPGSPQGIAAVVVSGPPGFENPVCWSLCETAVQGTPNAISSIVHNGNGTYTLNLARAITTNAVTALTYQPDTGNASRGVYTAHPANVNGDSASSPADIIFLIDILNGVAIAPHGLMSSDIDRSNQAGPPDILRVIDLLNGAAGYPNQLNRATPICGTCCP
jgi:hypothetical protein